jgi:hypothetical protein
MIQWPDTKQAVGGPIGSLGRGILGLRLPESLLKRPLKGPDKFSRQQAIERYRRLLKTATEEERRSHLRCLIVEEQRKQRDAGDSEYPY